MKKKKSFLCIFALMCLTLVSYSQTNQQDTVRVNIQTLDGNEFQGVITQEDSVKIYLKTQYLGEIAIPVSFIKSTESINAAQIKKGKLWFENPQATRYFWAPNGYGLKKGEGYYQNIYVFWNQFSAGITDNFSLGGGIIPLFLIDGAPTPIFFTPKISVPLEKNKVNIGAGALIGTILGESETGFGIVYGISTFGSRDNNVSLSLGYGYAGGEWAKSPLINVSGLFRVSSRGYFITENYYVSAGGEGFVAIGLGGRWIIKKAALDFMFGIPVGADMDIFVALPLIGFTIPFGHK